MKKNEIIELNGVEYTLELNRESFMAVDKICNIEKTFNDIKSGIYNYIDNVELSEDYDPYENIPNDEEIEKQGKEKVEKFKKVVERAFFVWLYPNHKLPLSEVKEILKPYLDGDDEKYSFIGEKTSELLGKCVEIRDQYNEERKNLIAQANK